MNRKAFLKSLGLGALGAAFAARKAGADSGRFSPLPSAHPLPTQAVTQQNPLPLTQPEHPMNLGAFSVSLAVKNLEASRQFYEKFGFTSFAGNAAQKWLILKNGDHVIGLFEGMFPKNTLTFNPGWDQNAQPVPGFTDIRELQKHLKTQGMQFVTEADEKTTGPASFMVMDPDGNPVLVDQHV